MSVLMVPGIDPEDTWPTLGPQIVQWMEDFLVFGPGPVQGQPYRLDPEKRGVIYRLYEVFPQGHPRAGRRRFKRAGISVRKGWAKTELMAAIAAAELHPDAPVRCDGFDANGQPVGIGVVNPYVPLVAFTEEQVEELAFGALVTMLSEGPLADDFDLGKGDARSGVIHVIGEKGRSAGKAVALAAAPSSRDGARTTFQGFDETHRQDTDRLRHAHQTMLNNLPKLGASDGWALEVTTSYEPGKDSIAERTHNYAKKIAKGEVENPTLFYYHRYASDAHDLNTRDGRMSALVEASGPAAAWTDLDYALDLSYEPDVDLEYWCRVWLNQEVNASGQYFPMKGSPDGEHKGLDDLALPRLDSGDLWTPKKGEMVCLGFDGSKSGDSTGIVGTDVLGGRQWVAGLWERPTDAQGRPEPGWTVPEDEVDQTLADLFASYDVVFMYPDPYWWEDNVARWIAKYGTRRIGKRNMHRVVEWHTNRPRPMAFALRAYRGAIRSGEMSWSGDERFRRHMANARKFDTGLVDDNREPLHTIRKERKDSPNKIDLAMCGALSWEARRDAVTLGVRPKSRGAFYAY